jgi:hypothetical protein
MGYDLHIRRTRGRDISPEEREASVDRSDGEFYDPSKPKRRLFGRS